MWKRTLCRYVLDWICEQSVGLSLISNVKYGPQKGWDDFHSGTPLFPFKLPEKMLALFFAYIIFTILKKHFACFYFEDLFCWYCLPHATEQHVYGWFFSQDSTCFFIYWRTVSAYICHQHSQWKSDWIIPAVPDTQVSQQPSEDKYCIYVLLQGVCVCVCFVCVQFCSPYIQF